MLAGRRRIRDSLDEQGTPPPRGKLNINKGRPAFAAREGESTLLALPLAALQHRTAAPETPAEMPSSPVDELRAVNPSPVTQGFVREQTAANGVRIRNADRSFIDKMTQLRQPGRLEASQNCFDFFPPPHSPFPFHQIRQKDTCIRNLISFIVHTIISSREHERRGKTMTSKYHVTRKHYTYTASNGPVVATFHLDPSGCCFHVGDSNVKVDSSTWRAALDAVKAIAAALPGGATAACSPGPICPVRLRPELIRKADDITAYSGAGVDQ